MPKFGQWTYTVDREATARAYALEPVDRYRCDCLGCRNFYAARPEVFPDAFLKFLDELGVDPRKEAEVYDLTELENGLHMYGGWFHFSGELSEAGDFAPVDFGPDFNATLTATYSPGFLHKLTDAKLVDLSSKAPPFPGAWKSPFPDRLAWGGVHMPHPTKGCHPGKPRSGLSGTYRLWRRGHWRIAGGRALPCQTEPMDPRSSPAAKPG